ncbi:MAG: hypothetical protein EAZ08_05665 [Cytophagales bacterium]|nr:MAG: hypothetical protein EAZ08_05665 [Cytophagales bacterium]
MKSVKYIYQLGLFSLLLLVGTSCRDEAKNPIPEWEAGLHALGQFVLPNGSLLPATDDATAAIAQTTINSQVFFQASNLAGSSIRFTVKPVSIDGRVEPDKMDLFIKMKEGYTDKDGNAKVAVHGITATTGLYIPQGVKFASFSGLSNRQGNQVTLTAAQVFEFFKSATFDYGDGKGKVSVFSRRANGNFAAGDNFEVSWSVTGKNGLVYNSWSGVYICSDTNATGGEVPGVNCFLRWIVR